jgi:hypothetical protein
MQRLQQSINDIDCNSVRHQVYISGNALLTDMQMHIGDVCGHTGSWGQEMITCHLNHLNAEKQIVRRHRKTVKSNAKHQLAHFFFLRQ